MEGLRAPGLPGVNPGGRLQKSVGDFFKLAQDFSNVLDEVKRKEAEKQKAFSLDWIHLQTEFDLEKKLFTTTHVQQPKMFSKNILVIEFIFFFFLCTKTFLSGYLVAILHTPLHLSFAFKKLTEL